MADFLNSLGEKAKNAGRDTKDRIYELAREHNLDPEHVENWPEEIKRKIA